MKIREEDIKISVIIPCYNATKYLFRTFQALENQTYQNFEVIIINDGSTDETENIARLWCSKADNRHLYSFENAGNSVARNRGLSYAKGNYIYFLDADDYFSPILFEDMVNIIKEKDEPDDIIFDYTCYTDNFDLERHVSYVLPQMKETDTIVYSETDIYEVLLRHVIGYSTDDVKMYYSTGNWPVKGMGYSVWSHLYKKSLIDKYHIRFRKTPKIGEDRIFNCLFLLYVQRVVYVSRTYYYYLTTPDGLLIKSLANPRFIVEDKIELLEAREEVRQRYLEEKGIEINEMYRGSTIIACFQLAIVTSILPYKEGYNLYHKYINHSLVKKAICGFPISGAPLKIKLPLLMIKNGGARFFFFLVWGARQCGIKVDSWR